MQPNVLLLVLDSVRARNVSLYGHPNLTTPFLEAFAEEATTYRQARAPSTWSLPSHVSMFTGLAVHEHSVVRLNQAVATDATIWIELANEGYETGVFSANPFLTQAPVGLKEAFETVGQRVDLPYPDAADPREFVRDHGTGQFLAYLRHCVANDNPLQSLANGVAEKFERDAPRLLPASVRPDPSDRTYVGRFLDWYRERDGPWAACVNLMDTHHPYEPRPEHDRWGSERLHALQADLDSQDWAFHGGARPWWERRALEALYDGAIRQADAELRRVVEALRAGGDFGETLVVITSDHGEGFGEPSHLRPELRVAGHGTGGLHEVLLHVPLVVRFPNQSTAETVEAVCSTTQFPHAVRATLDGSPAPDAFVPDRPVFASTFGLDERTRRNAQEYCEDVSRFEGEAKAVYEDHDNFVRKHAVWDDDSVAVDSRDAQTTYPAAGAECARDRIEAAYANLVDAGIAREADAVDEAVRHRLKDLGYV